VARQFDTEENVIRIPYDPLDPSGVRGIRVPLQRCQILVGEQDEDYFPIAAVTLKGRTRKDGLYYFEDSCGLARVSFWLTDLTKQTQGLPIVDFQIRGSVSCIAEVFFTGTIQPNDWEQQGLIVQVSGPLVTQWEFWAKVRPPNDVLTVALQAMVDRTGNSGVVSVIKGALVP